MNGKEFYEQFARRNKIAIAKSKKLCYAMFDMMSELFGEMEVGDRLCITGFGTFKKKKVAPHTVGDIRNGGTMQVPEGTKIVFEQSYVTKAD